MEARAEKKRTQKKRTPYQEYLDMPDGVRCELINGKIVMLDSPSPTHEEICTNVIGLLWHYLKGKKCQVYHGVGVRFREKEPINHALEPDIVVVCNPAMIHKEGIVGAPDFIIEVLSPSNTRNDTVWKLNLYQAEGVREYWIVNPEQRTVHTFILENGRYGIIAYDADERIPVSVLDNFEIDMSRVFPAAEA